MSADTYKFRYRRTLLEIAIIFSLYLVSAWLVSDFTELTPAISLN